VTYRKARNISLPSGDVAVDRKQSEHLLNEVRALLDARAERDLLPKRYVANGDIVLAALRCYRDRLKEAAPR
jgi:hypothetical protein